MDIKEQKQKLREKFLNIRTQLSEKEYLKKSDLIISKLRQQPEFAEASTVHCYVSMEERREVDTRSLIKEMLKNNRRVAVSVTDFETNTLNSFYISALDDLQKNKWGVLEPVKGKPADPDDFDLVIVPMVGGDRKRNRIGYGKGFYDRFLTRVQGTTVGLLFECCLRDAIPTEEFDITLHKVITEKRVIG